MKAAEYGAYLKQDDARKVFTQTAMTMPLTEAIYRQERLDRVAKGALVAFQALTMGPSQATPPPPEPSISSPQSGLSQRERNQLDYINQLLAEVKANPSYSPHFSSLHPTCRFFHI